MQLGRTLRGAAAVLGVALLLPAGGAAAQTVSTTASVPGPYITATGVAMVSTSGAMQTQGINVSVQSLSQNSGGIAAAVSQEQDKVQAVEAALEKVGVSASDIRVAGFNVSPHFGVVNPVPAGTIQNSSAPAIKVVTTTAQQSNGYNVIENLQVTVSGLGQLASAMSAAIAAGATNVNSYYNGGYQSQQPPATSSLTSAVAHATAQAKSLAQAAAQAASLTLGSIRSVSVQSSFGPTSCGPNGCSWRIPVTVTYNVGS